MVGRLLPLILIASSVALSDLQAQEPALLADRHIRWIEEAEVLLSPEERIAFDEITEDYRRDAFIEHFWRARDPHPETAHNEFRDLWETRLAAARQTFGTLWDARAQVFLLIGEPATRSDHICSPYLQRIEIWTAEEGSIPGGAGTIVFTKTSARQSGYRLWSPEEEGMAGLAATAGEAEAPEELTEIIRRSCPEGDQLARQLELAISPQMLRTLGAPAPDPSWIESFRSRSTETEQDVWTFPARLELAYPGRHRNRTIVEASVLVPLAELGSRESGAPRRFVMDGEILRKGGLFESFRYRFELPPEFALESEVPLVIQRYLRPGPYEMRLRVENLETQSFFQANTEIEVPVVDRAVDQTETEPQPAGTEPPTGSRTPAVTTEPHTPITEGDHSITLQRPPPGLHTGRLRVEASTTGQGIAKVAFELDRKPVMSKRRPPWSIEVDLGRAPRMHDLKARALDTSGNELASDEILVNAGPQTFSVRLVEPQSGREFRDRLRARAVVDVPRGEELDRLEFHVNDVLLSTLYQPPWLQSLPLPADSDLAYVRAVAYLKDGHSTEAVVFINSPGNMDQVDVDMVELYTTVVDRKGRPVENLRRSDFAVSENDVEQEIRRFEQARDLPFHAAIVIDSSTSMAQQLREAEKAALAFFQNVVTPRDRAAVVTFSDEPQLMVPFTSDLEILAGGLAGMEATGETALHDSVVFTLYHFGGLRGQRAIILLTDGEDSISHYSFAETLDFARESGVAIYTIGLDIPTRAHEARSKMRRISTETGGQSFFITRASQLDRVYRTIELELRSQYLLAYQSTLQGDDFRRVKVEMSDSSQTAKTIRGYDP